MDLVCVTDTPTHEFGMENRGCNKEKCLEVVVPQRRVPECEASLNTIEAKNTGKTISVALSLEFFKQSGRALTMTR